MKNKDDGLAITRFSFPMIAYKRVRRGERNVLSKPLAWRSLEVMEPLGQRAVMHVLFARICGQNSSV